MSLIFSCFSLSLSLSLSHCPYPARVSIRFSPRIIFSTTLYFREVQTNGFIVMFDRTNGKGTGMKGSFSNYSELFFDRPRGTKAQRGISCGQRAANVPTSFTRIAIMHEIRQPTSLRKYKRPTGRHTCKSLPPVWTPSMRTS